MPLSFLSRCTHSYNCYLPKPDGHRLAMQQEFPTRYTDFDVPNDAPAGVKFVVGCYCEKCNVTPVEIWIKQGHGGVVERDEDFEYFRQQYQKTLFFAQVSLFKTVNF